MYITSSYIFNKQGQKVTADEVVSIVKRIRDSDLKRSNVILDVVKGEVKKCRNFNLYGKVVNSNDAEPPTYQRLLDYFHAHHPQHIDVLLNAISTVKV
jgi:hypothetical protein